MKNQLVYNNTFYVHSIWTIILYILNEYKVDEHMLDTSAWVPMVKMQMGALTEDERKNRASQELVMRVFHELRNMINSILCPWSKKGEKTENQKKNKTIHNV